MLISRSFGPRSCWILCSIGRPWQSHPGTYGVWWPCIERKRRITSLSVLLIRWPMWMSPLAKGGPSCRIHWDPACGHPALPVEAHLLPFLQPLWLVLHELGFHRKAGLRQVESLFIAFLCSGFG